VSGPLNAKGGGRDETAQCNGTATDKVGEAVDLAKQFASVKLQ
jgi:alanyl-tRNA synthetase